MLNMVKAEANPGVIKHIPDPGAANIDDIPDLQLVPVKKKNIPGLANVDAEDLVKVNPGVAPIDANPEANLNQKVDRIAKNEELDVDADQLPNPGVCN